LVHFVPLVALASVAPGTTAAAAAFAHLAAYGLELLPLLGGQDLLQPLVSLAADLGNAWLRFLAQGSQLLACVAEDLLYFRLLLGGEIQTLRQLLDSIPRTTGAREAAIEIQRQNAGRKSQYENNSSRNSNLPPVLNDIVHVHLSLVAPITDPRRPCKSH
jgi:hypothetical protein